MAEVDFIWEHHLIWLGESKPDGNSPVEKVQTGLDLQQKL